VKFLSVHDSGLGWSVEMCIAYTFDMCIAYTMCIPYTYIHSEGVYTYAYVCTHTQVSAMCVLPSRGSIMVAGSFTRAFNLQEPFVVQTGGLALWRHSSNTSLPFWALAAAYVQGSPSSLLCDDHNAEVFVGGPVKFMVTDDSSPSGLGGGAGLAMLSLRHTAWRSLGGVQGVIGGQVLAMAISSDDLYVGGDFVSIAGVSAPGLAVLRRFRHLDSAKWFEVASLDLGVVRAMVSRGPNIYFAGDFSRVNNLAARVARFSPLPL